MIKTPDCIFFYFLVNLVGCTHIIDGCFFLSSLFVEKVDSSLFTVVYCLL